MIFVIGGPMVLVWLIFGVVALIFVVLGMLLAYLSLIRWLLKMVRSSEEMEQVSMK